jgi:hypothetical protein
MGGEMRVCLAAARARDYTVGRAGNPLCPIGAGRILKIFNFGRTKLCFNNDARFIYSSAPIWTKQKKQVEK